MGKITIFRYTDDTDDILAMPNPIPNPFLDKIDFNTTTKTTAPDNFINALKFNPSDGVGNNQGAEQNLGDQQALGEVENIIKISGFFSQRNAEAHAGIAKMKQWQEGPKINDDWQLGRFGFMDADDVTEDVIPIKTGPDQVALLWERIEWTVDFKGNRKLFDLFLRVNRGDGT